MTADDIARREAEAIDAALAGEPVPPELTELGRLALALREEREAPAPRFARELDARAAAGFPRRRRRLASLATSFQRRPVLIPGTVVAGLAAVLVAVVIVGGGGTGGMDGAGGDSAGSSGGASSAAAPETSAAEESAGSARDSAGASSSLAAPSPVPPGGGGGSSRTDGKQRRAVERSAAITLAARPRDVANAADRIVAVADRVGGFVQRSSVTAGGAGGGGEFLLRVPTTRLDDAVAQLSRIAHVRERRQDAEDITAERTSVADRLQEERAERTSLLKRLAAAQTETEAASLRARLRDVNARIGANRAALRRVDNRARYADVQVTLVADPAAGATGGRDDGGGWSPGDAARDAVRVLEVVAGVLLVGLAVLGPLALLAALLVAARRAAARRGRERALDAV